MTALRECRGGKQKVRKLDQFRQPCRSRKTSALAGQRANGLHCVASHTRLPSGVTFRCRLFNASCRSPHGLLQLNRFEILRRGQSHSANQPRWQTV